MSGKSVIVAETVALTVRFGSRTVVDDVSLIVRAGERWGLVGESGSGKSLTLAVLAGLTPRNAAVTGRARVAGQDVVGVKEQALSRVRGRAVALMLQDSAVALNPLVPVGAQVALPIRALHGRTRAAARAEVFERLSAVGFPDPQAVADAYPGRLSGGQRQRVCLAMALACGARLLLADEPTTALDPPVARDVLDLLSSSLGPDRALLLVSHDLAVVAQVCDRVAVLRGGRVLEHGTVSEVVGAPREPYTRTLVEAARLLVPR